MPVAAKPILWSEVTEIPNVDGDEHMVLLKKISTSPDKTEWRRYKIGDYFQEIENRFNQLQALLAPPESGTWIPAVSGITLVSYRYCNWHIIGDRLFFSCELTVSGNASSFVVSGLPKDQTGRETYTVIPATWTPVYAVTSITGAGSFVVALQQLASHSNSIYGISGSYRFNPQL